jgi:RNA polymerase sigma factor (sigma-70 family)
MRFEYTDEILVSLFVQTRQNIYFDQLYRRYFERVCRQCRQFTTDPTEAEDLAQEIFIKLIDRLDSFRETARFSTWIGSVARNFCIDQLRRQKTLHLVMFSQQPNLPEPGEWHEPETEIYDPQRLDTALGRLSFGEVQLLTTRYWKKTSISDMARQEKLTNSAVKMRLFRARERLRTAYQEID